MGPIDSVKVTRTFTSSAKRADITIPARRKKEGLSEGLDSGRRGDGRRPLGRAPHSRARAGFRPKTSSSGVGTSHILWAGMVMTDYQSVALPLSYGPRRNRRDSNPLLTGGPDTVEPLALASDPCRDTHDGRRAENHCWLHPPRQRVTWGFAGIEPAVWAAGFEPATSRLRTELSATLRYTQKIGKWDCE